MSVPSIPSAVILPADIPGLESYLDRLSRAERGFECGLSYTRMMQGAALSELRRLHPEGRGGDRKSKNQTPNNLEFDLPWADYVHQRFGFTAETARARIAMWEVGRPRLKKLADEVRAGLSAIFERPISSLNEDEFQLVQKVTHKLTDGKTVRMIQEELGLFKGDAPKPKGGKVSRPNGTHRRTDEEIAQTMATTLAEAWHENLKACLEVGIDNPGHTRWLAPEKITDLKRLLKDALTLLSQPLPDLNARP